MGKRLRKAPLLEEIARERAALDDAVYALPPRQMTRAGVTPGGWSVKDILAHLVAWQQLNLEWYAAGRRGETPAMPAPGYTLRDLPRFNQMLYRKHRRRSLRAILSDYVTYHQRVLALITSLSDRELVTLRRYTWLGPSWALSDYLRASTAAHYLWARKRIRRWMRAEGLAAERAPSARTLPN